MKPTERAESTIQRERELPLINSEKERECEGSLERELEERLKRLV